MYIVCFFTTTSKVHKFQYDHIFHPSVESFEPLVSSWFVSCGLLHRCTLWIPNWAPNHQFTISWLHWIANFSTRQGALRQASQGRTSSCYSGGKGWNGRLCQILPPLNFWNQVLNDDMWHHKWWILDMFCCYVQVVSDSFWLVNLFRAKDWQELQMGLSIRNQDIERGPKSRTRRQALRWMGGLRFETSLGPKIMVIHLFFCDVWGRISWDIHLKPRQMISNYRRLKSKVTFFSCG